MLLDVRNSAKEIEHNLTSPVLWHSTVQSLANEEGMTTYAHVDWTYEYSF